jgi:hypothetical protein
MLQKKRGRGMRGTTKRIAYVLMWYLIPYALVAQVPYNELTELSYHQGELVDTIICYFKDSPSCIYEPTPLSKRQEHVRSACFFLPFTYVRSDACKRMMKQLQVPSNGYTVAFEPVIKPVGGLRVRLTYDPEKIGWEYGPSDALNPKKGLVFKLYNKHLLRTISQNSTPLRWYAQGKHQPRIVIDTAHDTGRFYKQSTSDYLSGQIASILKRKGCEVLFTQYTDKRVAPSIRTGYANVYARADIFLTLASSADANPAVFILSPALFKVKQSTLTIKERHQLAQLTKWVHIQSALLETAVDNNLKTLVKAPEVPLFPATRTDYSEVLAGVEMPALCVEIGTLHIKKENKTAEIAEAIASGILSYISEKKFLKVLYKDEGCGKLKITLNTR